VLSFQAALRRYLTEPLGRQCCVTPTERRSLAAVLDRGDVLLTDANTRCAALVRHVTRSVWSHVSMYVGPLEQAADPLCIVEADIAAGVRPVRLSELNALRVQVLRPAALSKAERDWLADCVVSRIGAEYDLAHAWQLGRRHLLSGRSRRTGGTISMPTRRRPSRFICSSLVAHAFASLGYSILPDGKAAGARASGDHGHLTPADFEHAPVFQVVWPLDATASHASPRSA